MYAKPIAGSTLVAASDVVTMILPNPRGRMWRAAARAVAKTPLRLMSITRFQRSSVYRSSAPSSSLGRWPPAQAPTKPTPGSMPAFANATSSRPYVSAASSIARSSAA